MAGYATAAKTVLGEKYQANLSLLDHAQQRDLATDDFAYFHQTAQNMVRNLKKMPHERREAIQRNENISYQSLVDRARAIAKTYDATAQRTASDIACLTSTFTTLENEVQQHSLTPARAEMIAAVYDQAHKLGANELLYRMDAAMTKADLAPDTTIDAPVVPAPKGLFTRIAQYAKNMARTAALVGLTYTLSCSPEPDYKLPCKHEPAHQVTLPAAQPIAYEPVTPVLAPIQAEPVKSEAPVAPQSAPAVEPVQPKPEPAPAVQPVQETIKPVETHVQQVQPEKTEPVARAPARQEYETPRTYERMPASRSESTVSIKDILRGEAYFDSETRRYGGTNKLIADFGNFGIDAYVSAFDQEQDFDTTDVSADGKRFWAGAHGYLPLSSNLLGYGEVTGGVEQRDFTIAFESGIPDFEFGNSSPFLNIKLGLTDGNVGDPDDHGVGNKHNYALAQFTRHWGDVKGDVDDFGFEDDYDSFRFLLNSQLMVGENTAVRAGISTIDEQFGDFLEQKNWYAQGGVRQFFTINDNPVYVDASILYQDMNGELAGNDSDDKRWAPQLSVGLRAIQAEHFDFDIEGFVGSWNGSEDNDGGYGGIGGTLYLGGSKKKQH